MEKVKKQILDKTQILQKVKRMAYEIYEQNYRTEALVLAGIDAMGYQLSGLLKTELEKISDTGIYRVRIDIDKQATSQPRVEIHDFPELPGFTLIIVDDVLNSGRTMAHTLAPFLEMNIRNIQTAVLVNRSHKRFPIAVDYKGLELATTLQEHIEVQLTESDFSAYLY